MADSRFWRTLAVFCVANVCYLAHGCHDSSDSSLPGLTHELHAGDVATAVSERSSSIKIITSSDDGRTINLWTTTKSNNFATFQDSFTAKPK
jgi:hypothetical protein